MNLYERIKQLGEQQEKSIYRIEKDCGLSNGSIRKWSKSIPSAESAQSVADYLNVDVNYLLGRTDSPTAETIPAPPMASPRPDLVIKRISTLIDNSKRSASSIFKELKMPHNALTEWNKGKANPSTDALSKIADYFNTSVDYLLVRTDEIKPYPPSVLLKKEKPTETIEAATDIAEPKPDIANDAPPISNIKKSSTKAPFPKLMELPEDFTPTGAIPLSPIEYAIPIVGVVRAGIGGAAHEDIEGYESVSKSDLNGHDTSEYFWLRVKGDSMEPELYEGDLVLVHKQTSVDSGTLAVVLVDDIADSEGLVKIVNYGHDWIELVSNNENYPPRRFEQQDVLRIYVVGAVVQSKRIYSRVNRYKTKM